MNDNEVLENIEDNEVISTKRPWYSLDPRSISRSRLIWIILSALVIASISVVPLWRFTWRYSIYSFWNFNLEQKRKKLKLGIYFPEQAEHCHARDEACCSRS